LDWNWRPARLSLSRAQLARIYWGAVSNVRRRPRDAETEQLIENLERGFRATWKAMRPAQQA
jgi:hypothetical protein